MKSALIGIVFLPALVLAQTGTVVEGRVTNRLTGDGISNIHVNLRSGMEVQRTTTDNAGVYKLESLKAGEYTATFTDWTNQLFPTHSGTPLGTFKIPADGTTQLDAEFAPPGVLRGRVVDESGSPVPNISVAADVTGPTGPYVDAVTEQNGVFSLSVPGGFHYVSIYPSDPAPAGLTWTSTGVVLVRAGTLTDGYEIRRRRLPLNRVRGVLVDETGKPIPGVEVSLSEPRAEIAGINGVSSFTYPQAAAVTVSAADGSFEFDAVASGDWRFQAEAELKGHHLEGTEYVTVKTDVSDVRIKLAQSFSMDVRIEWLGVPKTAFPDASATLVALGIPPLTDGLQDDAHFSHSERLEELFPGRYAVRALPSTSSSYYPTSVLLGTHEVMGHEFTLGPDSPALRIIYSDPGGGTLRVNFKRRPAAALVLYPVILDDARQIRVIDCGAERPCEMRGVAPGDYDAFVFPAIELFALTTPAFRTATMADATRVHISQGAIFSLDLPVTRWPE